MHGVRTLWSVCRTDKISPCQSPPILLRLLTIFQSWFSFLVLLYDDDATRFTFLELIAISCKVDPDFSGIWISITTNRLLHHLLFLVDKTELVSGGNLLGEFLVILLCLPLRSGNEGFCESCIVLWS